MPFPDEAEQADFLQLPTADDGQIDGGDTAMGNHAGSEVLSKH